MSTIPFNRPPVVGSERTYLEQLIKERSKLSGDGRFTKACHTLLEKSLGVQKSLLTTSCTHALEMSALLAEIQAGDEVIMPSYTFVSTANAFVLRGAKIIFVDIRPDTMNLDENQIEKAVSKKTKAIVPVHYAGVGCEMDKINDIAKHFKVLVIEDAAQGISSYYRGKPLGSLGDLACLSFHETKNISCGEGGALLINNKSYNQRAEIIREKGTNRSRFFRGEVDKYSWVDLGSSYLPSEFNAAVLLAQLEEAERINQDRLSSWNFYYENLADLAEKEYIELPHVPEHCTHNAHMFYIKSQTIEVREKLMSYLKEHKVNSVFHYIPLHSSEAGQKFGLFSGEDRFTTKESDRLLRLPLYFEITKEELQRVIELIDKFFLKH